MLLSRGINDGVHTHACFVGHRTSQAVLILALCGHWDVKQEPHGHMKTFNRV